MFAAPTSAGGATALVALAAVLAVMVFGVLNGLLAAIAFSLAMLLQSLASPHLCGARAHGRARLRQPRRAFRTRVTVPGMLVLRPEEPLFFANAEPLLAQARQQVLAQPAATARGAQPRGIAGSRQHGARDARGVLQLAHAARRVHLRVARLKDAAREALAARRFTQLPAAALDYSSVDDAVRGEPLAPPGAPAANS